MPIDNFFTIFKNYFKLCFCRDCCLSKDADERSADRYNSSDNSNMSAGDKSPYSFDDLSNPLSPSMTNSSSGSSIDSFYNRPKFKPYVGIIPANYYNE